MLLTYAQLNVKDFLKKFTSNKRNVVAKANKFVATVRTSIHDSEVISHAALCELIMPVETRWDSQFLMLESVIKLSNNIDFSLLAANSNTPYSRVSCQ